MEINRSSVLDIVQKCGLNADKNYGQNFLTEPSISKRIVDLLVIKKDDFILEVGPGLGSLTHFICQNDNKITIVDIDERMTNFLKIHYSFKNVEIINDDIRKIDICKYSKIVANLPYNITSDLITYFLENTNQCKKMVLMCQKETFSHFFDVSGKEYGPLSIFIHLLGDIKKQFVVKPGSFYPSPKCDSVVFEINPFDNIDKNKAISVYKMSKKLFVNRRKTIFNNLSQYLKNKEIATNILNEIDIPLNLRPEQIPYEKFVVIYEKTSEFNFN